MWWRGRKFGLATVLTVCLGVASYSGLSGEGLSRLLGDSDAVRLLSDIPSDITGTVKRVYSILGHPKDNFESAMRGFEDNAARINGRSIRHEDYSRIYMMLDINNIIGQLKDLKLKENYEVTDSVLEKYGRFDNVL